MLKAQDCVIRSSRLGRFSRVALTTANPLVVRLKL